MSIKRSRAQGAIRTLEALSGGRLTFGKLLLAIREGEEATQADFADKLGISRHYLSDLENGRRSVSPKFAAQCAKRLGYSNEQFVRLCLQDIVDRDGIDLVITVQVA